MGIPAATAVGGLTATPRPVCAAGRASHPVADVHAGSLGLAVLGHGALGIRVRPAYASIRRHHALCLKNDRALSRAHRRSSSGGTWTSAPQGHHPDEGLNAPLKRVDAHPERCRRLLARVENPLDGGHRPLSPAARGHSPARSDVFVRLASWSSDLSTSLLPSFCLGFAKARIYSILIAVITLMLGWRCCGRPRS